MDRSASSSDLSTADIGWHTPASLGPVIVHKRRRVVEAPNAADLPAQPGWGDSARGSRVFTVRALTPTAEPAAEPAAAPASPASPRTRRMRDAAHRPGEVTRIVFTPEADAPPAPTPAPSEALPGEAKAFVQVQSELDALLDDVKRSAYFAHLKFF